MEHLATRSPGRQHRDACTAIDNRILATRQCHDLGPRVDEHDVIERNTCTLGNAAHLLDILRAKTLHLRKIPADQRCRLLLADAQPLEPSR